MICDFRYLLGVLECIPLTDKEAIILLFLTQTGKPQDLTKSIVEV